MASLRPADTRNSGPTEAGEAMRVLVVDDDQSVLDVAERLLIADGYVPILTGAPHSALQIARSMRPGAILLDVLMPGFDGWDVLAALKSDPQTSAIPVLMICMLGERGRALEAGADGVVPKPLESSNVSAALHAVLPETGRRQRAAGR
ncbi:response regulator [Devosia sp.]|uniref:response regulator n=1 Tax=Devosia sp. TaxID=1871048 RepID=UPI0025C0FBBB|nr:response regulator [Devosia sp.]